MTKPSGIISVRERCDGGDVATEVTEIPLGWTRGNHHLVLMVHGFNNNVDEARSAFSKLTDKLPECFPKVGWFYWPGDADMGWFDFLDFLSYPTDIPDAQESALHLANTLTRLAQETPGLQITLVGHSLGCRLITECIHLLAARRASDRPQINALLFMAAAVPVDLVESDQALGQSIRELAPNGYVFHSTDDLVLQFAFPAGQTLAAAMGYEPNIYLEAVGRHGSPTDLFPTNPENRAGNRHGDYWNDAKVAATLCTLGQAAVTRRTEYHFPPSSRELPLHQLPRWSSADCKMF